MFRTSKRQPVSDEQPATYNGSQVSGIARVSLRQLQWWDERKIVSPAHEGHKRLYSRQETIEISIIAELRRKGFSLQKIRRVLRFMQRELGKRLGDVGAGLQLLTDGKSIYMEDEHERIIDLLNESDQPMFVISVSDQVARVDGSDRPSGKPVASATVGRARVRGQGRLGP